MQYKIQNFVIVVYKYIVNNYITFTLHINMITAKMNALAVQNPHHKCDWVTRTIITDN